MSDDAKEPTQQTKPAKGKPMTIRIPSRGEFDEFVRKIAGGRKRPAETDSPPEQSD
jgi:hypothetical protein